MRTLTPPHHSAIRRTITKPAAISRPSPSDTAEYCISWSALGPACFAQMLARSHRERPHHDCRRPARGRSKLCRASSRACERAAQPRGAGESCLSPGRLALTRARTDLLYARNRARADCLNARNRARADLLYARNSARPRADNLVRSSLRWTRAVRRSHELRVDHQVSMHGAHSRLRSIRAFLYRHHSGTHLPSQFRLRASH